MWNGYQVEYTLKIHRRDQLIDWIKSLLAVPFVLHSQADTTYSRCDDVSSSIASASHQRYCEILKDAENLINDHVAHQALGVPQKSKLKHLVPSVGTFFTPLQVEEAFRYQDERRRISSRRFVPPSFNDIRLLLNTAQLLSVAGTLQLVTFDGDVTLYHDGGSLRYPENRAIIDRLIAVLRRGVNVAIVTAAGYTDARKYYERLSDLLEKIRETEESQGMLRSRFLVMGGESNYLFHYCPYETYLLRRVAPADWLLPEMRAWNIDSIISLLVIAESVLRECVVALAMDADILRKDRAVGIIPSSTNRDRRPFTREQLEETVLATQRVLETSQLSLDLEHRVPFCVFKGGEDVFVDIGDKSWGIRACQSYLGGIEGSKTLHVGDQFLSAGANDFKARSACCTAWVASPEETVNLLDEMAEFVSVKGCS